MNKISNWLFGSFFRTIGRVIAFIFIGGLIGYFIQSNGLLDGFSIADLFGIQKVNASTYVSENIFGKFGTNVSRCEGYNTPTNCERLSVVNGFYRDSIAFVKDSITYYQSLIYFNSNGTTTVTVPTGAKSIHIPIRVYSNDGTIPTYGFISEPEYDQVGDTLSFIVETFSYNNTVGICNLDSSVGDIYYLSCPVTNNIRIIRIRLYYNFSKYATGSTNLVYYGYKDAWSWEIDDESIAIEEQTEQQQQQHEEAMQQQEQQHNETQSYLEDSNTSQAENDATEFFQGFSNTDHGGLSAIITAPLNTIRSLLNSTCTNLVLPLPFVNENLTLPCLNSIYTEFFGAFFTIYQTIILGIIAYKCIRSIYYDIHGFMDPNDDRIEVMDL